MVMKSYIECHAYIMYVSSYIYNLYSIVNMIQIYMYT